MKFIVENKNKNESKFKFQGTYVRSQCWFDLDFDWIGVYFSTREPGFYKELFQIHENTQDTNTFKFFQVSIENSKCVENFKFHNDAPMLKYCQRSLNRCCFNSLASDVATIEKTNYDNAISLHIE